MSTSREIFTLLLNFFYLVILVFLLIYRKRLGKQIWLFIFAMLTVVITEWGVFIVRIFNTQFNVNLFYSVGIAVVFFSVMLIYFYKILETPRLKKIQLLIIVLNMLNLLASFYLIEDFFSTFSFYNYFVSIILLLFSVMLFFYETFNSEKILQIKSYYPFWISISLVFIYLGILPLLIMSQTVGEKLNGNIFGAMLFSINLIGYSILFIGIFYSKNDFQKKLKFEK